MIENRKCGSLPDHINYERNWGYGYDDLISDLSEWSQSPYVIIDFSVAMYNLFAHEEKHNPILP